LSPHGRIVATTCRLRLEIIVVVTVLLGFIVLILVHYRQVDRFTLDILSIRTFIHWRYVIWDNECIVIIVIVLLLLAAVHNKISALRSLSLDKNIGLSAIGPR